MFVNLTPHDLNIHTHTGVFVIPASGTVARVATVNEEAPSIAITRTACHGECGGCSQMVLDGEACICEQLGVPWSIPTVTTSFGEVTGMPDPQPGVFLIVSGMVASAAARSDVFSPGDLVRDENGRPVGCRGLRRSC
jgi:hypothetical protein